MYKANHILYFTNLYNPWIHTPLLIKVTEDYPFLEEVFQIELLLTQSLRLWKQIRYHNRTSSWMTTREQHLVRCWSYIFKLPTCSTPHKSKSNIWLSVPMLWFKYICVDISTFAYMHERITMHQNIKSWSNIWMLAAHDQFERPRIHTHLY